MTQLQYKQWNERFSLDELSCDSLIGKAFWTTNLEGRGFS